MAWTGKKIVILSIFIALGVSLGFIFTIVPNVELVTTTIFIAGYFMGWREGLFVGLITEGIYSLFNPYGMAAPPLFIAQIVAMSITGFLGGMTSKLPGKDKKHFILLLGGIGLTSTFIFGLLTTLSFVTFTGLSLTKLLSAVVYGLGFYVTHMISNTIIFLTLVPLLIKTLPKVVHSFAVKTTGDPHESAI